MREVLRNYQKNGSSIAIMQASDDSILYKVLLTKNFICFLLPYLRVLRDKSHIHLIDFVAQITLKGGRLGLLKCGSKEG